jgi:CheY-like chemotaxis protein
MLELLGYQVCMAVNGFEAIEQFQTQPPDAILMDCQLPEMDGYAATQHIREQERTLGRHVPIIALTASALAGERERCLAAGMDDYLAKPFRMKDLEEVMQRVLGAASQPTPAAKPEHRTGEIPVGDGESEPPLLDADAFWIGTGITPGSHSAHHLAHQIIATFQSDVAAQMQELRAAMERQDAKEVRAIAHRLYGSAAQLGARQLAQALKRLEKAPDASTWPAQFQVVEEVSAATSRAFDEALQRKALVQTPHGWPHG